MKTLVEYINERYVNLFYDDTDDIEKMRKYSHQVWEMANTAYQYCGGIADGKTYEEFVKNYIDVAPQEKLFWKLVRRDEKITAFRIYTLKRQGRKGTMMACLPTEEGRNDIKKLLQEDYKLKDRGVWAENSGKALMSALKNGAQLISNTVIKSLMPDKEITLLADGFFYKRKIGGKLHTKCLVGTLINSEENKGVTTELYDKIKELAFKYEEEDNED